MSRIMFDYSPKGTRIQYTGNNGYYHDYKYAKEKGLVTDQRYEVDHTEVHDSKTDVWLKGIEGKFNSAIFAPAYEFDALVWELVDTSLWFLWRVENMDVRSVRTYHRFRDSLVKLGVLQIDI